MDRCLPDRVVEIFESIKLFLDCQHCVFILGFDKDQIKKAFDTKFSPSERLGSRYVEKFVQLEFELPRKLPFQVEEFVRNVAPTPLKENKAIVEMISRFIQPNPRKILRWINQVAFVQELLRFGSSDSSASKSKDTDELVPIWVFIKSFFPEFAALVETDQSILSLVLKRVRNEASPSEMERIKTITLDKVLEDFLQSVDPSIASDPRLPEVIFHTRVTITESVSVLQPQSLIEKLDGVTSEEADTLAEKMVTENKAKALEMAKLIGEQFPSITSRSEFRAYANRLRFLEKVVSAATSESERSTLFEMLMKIQRSVQGKFIASYGDALRGLLKDPAIRKQALDKGYVDFYVSGLVDSGSWDTAGEYSEILVLFTTDLTETQVNKIALAALSNEQIYASFRAQPDISKILKANKHLINSAALDRLKKERQTNFGLQ